MSVADVSPMKNGNFWILRIHKHEGPPIKSFHIKQIKLVRPITGNQHFIGGQCIQMLTHDDFQMCVDKTGDNNIEGWMVIGNQNVAILHTQRFEIRMRVKDGSQDLRGICPSILITQARRQNNCCAMLEYDQVCSTVGVKGHTLQNRVI